MDFGSSISFSPSPCQTQETRFTSSHRTTSRISPHASLDRSCKSEDPWDQIPWEYSSSLLFNRQYAYRYTPLLSLFRSGFCFLALFRSAQLLFLPYVPYGHPMHKQLKRIRCLQLFSAFFPLPFLTSLEIEAIHALSILAHGWHLPFLPSWFAFLGTMAYGRSCRLLSCWSLLFAPCDARSFYRSAQEFSFRYPSYLSAYPLSAFPREAAGRR